MSLTTDNMSAADLAAITGNRGNSGFGYGDGFLYWIIILFFFGMFNGNGGWGGNGNGGNGMGLYPWMNQSNQMNDGFRDQMLYGQINGIQNSITSGFGDVATALCGGFAGVNASVNSAQNAIAQQLYGNQIADMQQMFGFQNAMNQGFNSSMMQNAQNTQSIVQAFNAGIQSVKDQLCDYRNAQKDETIANLRQELMFSRGQASQVEQTAQLRASQATTANQLVNELRSCPIPSQPVYGNQPIFTCPQNQYSPCGCNGNNF